MPVTPTANVGLRKQAVADRDWHTPLNTSLDLLDALAPVGGLAVRAAEIPSASLNVRVAAGRFAGADGLEVAYAGAAAFAVPNGTTTALWLDAAGALQSGAAFPATAHAPLALVTAAGGLVTAVADRRPAFGVIGSASAGAPVQATFVTLTTNATLENERVLTAGSGISITDAGAGSTVTVALAAPVSAANGGTGRATLTANKILVGDGAGQVKLGDIVAGSGASVTYDAGTATWTVAGVSGGGTVTSVGLTAPAEIAVAGSPITAAGTLALTWASAAANRVLASPDGSAGTPAFRALLAADIPTLDAGTKLSGTLPQANGGTGFTGYTDAQILAGRTSTGGLEKWTIAAGTGITVTVDNAAFTWTIAATGSGGAGAPTDAKYVTVGNDSRLSAELALTGTANRVTITEVGTSVIVSTPQDMHTGAIPTFNGQTLTPKPTPPAPGAGERWTDSDRNAAGSRVGGLTGWHSRVIYATTTPGAVAGTTAEGSLLGTGAGTSTLPANFLAAGKAIRAEAAGWFTTDGSTIADLRVKLGGTTVGAAMRFTAGIANGPWKLEAHLHCESTGVSGTIRYACLLTFATAAGAPTVKFTHGTTTRDTTGALAVDVTSQLSAADASEVRVGGLTLKADC